MNSIEGVQVGILDIEADGGDVPDSSEVWLDGGHNIAGAQIIKKWIINEKIHNIILVCGFLKNKDVPGVIGKVGTILGNQNVNIAAYHLSRSKDSEFAYAIIKLDNPATQAVLNSLKVLNDLLEVIPLSVI